MLLDRFRWISPDVLCYVIFAVYCCLYKNLVELGGTHHYFYNFSISQNSKCAENLNGSVKATITGRLHVTGSPFFEKNLICEKRARLWR
jgi:hypothetical protein